MMEKCAGCCVRKLYVIIVTCGAAVYCDRDTATIDENKTREKTPHEISFLIDIYLSADFTRHSGIFP